MRKETCHREDEVLGCLKTGKLSPELQKHISACPVCQNIALVQDWMEQFKTRSWDASVRNKNLPSPEALWNRAYYRSRSDKNLVRKAMRPLIIPQVLFYAVFVAGIIFMTVWGLKKFGNILDNRVISQILPFFGIMMIIVFVSLSFCALVVAFVKRKHPI